ncbi:hypothetical protein MBLNU230_g6452t1 [Neophaeotheca triangularis]
MSAAIENPQVTGESKSARKKKGKADAGKITAGDATALPQEPSKENSSSGDKVDGDGSFESPYIKELQKSMRNINKKLNSMQKIDAIIAENPNTSIDDLVASRKLNNDQRASALKKPQLQAQLTQLEDQVTQYRKVDTEYQSQLAKQREELTAQHQQEVERVTAEVKEQAATNNAKEVRRHLLLFSQFLRAAAAKRTVEEDSEQDENKVFEGILLLVYGGDQKAVDTAIKLVKGSEEHAPSIDGTALAVSYAQIKKASMDHAPFQAEEDWVDSVAQATASSNQQQTQETGAVPAGSDPTLVNAGMTEMDRSAQTNGVASTEDAYPSQAAADDSQGNAAGDRWDTTAAGTAAGAETATTEEGFEMVPRPNEEVDNPSDAAPPSTTTTGNPSWADDVVAPTGYETGAAGNTAGESWDTKVIGEAGGWGQETTTIPNSADNNGWADGAADTGAGARGAADGGFHEVSGRHRGARGGPRGGRGDGGDGRGRGRGRGGFRGRGRGGEGGEFRGRGGRGRGAPRGGDAPARS